MPLKGSTFYIVTIESAAKDESQLINLLDAVKCMFECSRATMTANCTRGLTNLCTLQDKGGGGAEELQALHSDRMKVVQLDVCSDELVNQAVDYVKANLEDSERGNMNLPHLIVFHLV